MSFFSGLDTERYDRQYSDRQLVRRMVAYFNPHRMRVAAITLYLLVTRPSQLSSPRGWIPSMKA
jgi:hypothetical protein